LAVGRLRPRGLRLFEIHGLTRASPQSGGRLPSIEVNPPIRVIPRSCKSPRCGRASVSIKDLQPTHRQHGQALVEWFMAARRSFADTPDALPPLRFEVVEAAQILRMSRAQLYNRIQDGSINPHTSRHVLRSKELQRAVVSCRAGTVRRSSKPSSTGEGAYSIFSGAQLDLFASTTPAPRVRRSYSADTHRRARTGTESYAKVTPDLVGASESRITY
jgi:hypothetical protein